MSDIELLPFRYGRESGFNRTQDHYEADITRSNAQYADQIQYVSDHSICELFIRGRNWRTFAERALRVGEPIDNRVMLIKEDNLQFSVQHNFEVLRSTGGLTSGFVKLAEGAQGLAGGIAAGVAGIRGETDLMVAPMRLFDARFYKGSEPLDLSSSFTFRMGQAGIWDAKKEVFDPLIALLIMFTAIDEQRTLSLTGRDDGGNLSLPVHTTPGASKYGLIGGMGSEVLSGLEDTEGENLSENITDFLRTFTSDAEETLEDGTSGAVTFVVGMGFHESTNEDFQNHQQEEGGSDITRDSMNNRNVFYFDPCFVESITVDMSSEKDMRGYPIEGSIQLSIKTMFPVLGNDFSQLRQGEEIDALTQEQLDEQAQGVFDVDATTGAAAPGEADEEDEE